MPSYIVKNEKDEDVDVATLAAEKGVILFLVPKADTREHHNYIRIADWYLIGDGLQRVARSKPAVSVTYTPTSRRSTSTCTA